LFWLKQQKQTNKSRQKDRPDLVIDGLALCFFFCFFYNVQVGPSSCGGLGLHGGGQDKILKANQDARRKLTYASVFCTLFMIAEVLTVFFHYCYAMMRKIIVIIIVVVVIIIIIIIIIRRRRRRRRMIVYIILHDLMAFYFVDYWWFVCKQFSCADRCSSLAFRLGRLSYFYFCLGMCTVAVF
jgi:hypothetical protein